MTWSLTHSSTLFASEISKMRRNLQISCNIISFTTNDKLFLCFFPFFFRGKKGIWHISKGFMIFWGVILTLKNILQLQDEPQKTINIKFMVTSVYFRGNCLKTTCWRDFFSSSNGCHCVLTCTSSSPLHQVPCSSFPAPLIRTSLQLLSIQGITEKEPALTCKEHKKLNHPSLWKTDYKAGRNEIK